MKCSYCDREMTDPAGQGCSVADATVERVRYERRRFGEPRPRQWHEDPKIWTPAASPPAGTRCHDCGTPLGGFHHPGCDDDLCPRCLGQAISCGCRWDDEQEEDIPDEHPDARVIGPGGHVVQGNHFIDGPQRPANVRVLHRDGTVTPLELAYQGVNAMGINIWAAATAIRLGRGDRLLAGVIPAKTAITFPVPDDDEPHIERARE